MGDCHTYDDTIDRNIEVLEQCLFVSVYSSRTMSSHILWALQQCSIRVKDCRYWVACLESRLWRPFENMLHIIRCKIQKWRSDWFFMSQATMGQYFYFTTFTTFLSHQMLIELLLKNKEIIYWNLEYLSVLYCYFKRGMQTIGHY